jgi:serine protease Do
MKPSHVTKSTGRLIAVIEIVIILLAWGYESVASETEAFERTDTALVKAAQKVLPAVVNISSLIPGKVEGEDARDQGIGAGLIIAPNGLILTSAHVVRGTSPIRVTLSDRRSYRAVPLALDVESDLAVIKIEAEGLQIAEWGDSSKLAVGQIVLTVGSPFGLSRTVTLGIVSAVNRTNVGIIDYEEFIQTDAPINPGSSGGPVVDIQGRVVGITTAMASRGGFSQGVGFVVPSNSARPILEQLIRDGKVRRGALGLNIQDIDTALAKAFGRPNLEGALVAQVTKDGPAEKSGIREGDIILSFNAETVTSSNHLKNLIGRQKPGDNAKLSVYRRPDIFDLDVTLGQRSSRESSGETRDNSKEKPQSLGVVVETVSGFTARRLGLSSAQGLHVKKVDDEGLGALIGLKQGDVVLEIDDKPARDVAQFKAAVAGAEKDKPVLFKIKRGESKIFAAYEPK